MAVDWLALWLLVSAWCTLSGWLLSSLGMLNRLGYGILLFLFLGLLGFYHEPLGLIRPDHRTFRLPPSFRRNWLPKAWLFLAFLAFLGALIYHPNNYDYLAYRFPRVLHWSWEQQWHWIATPTKRMNVAATGFEWLMVPIFVFFQTDRLFFLINTVSFFLLPGVIFAVFHRLGVSKRIAWWWMWVLPCGFCYALQAGSVSNDLFATVYLLASFFYLLRLNEENSAPARNFFFSCLAMALATGAKASNLPLMLPWVIALAFQGNQVLKIRPVILAGTFFLAALISFLTTALWNIHYTGTYTGDPHDESMMQQPDPIGGLVGNSFFIGLQNLKPPLWPSEVPLTDLIPGSFFDYLTRTYPRLHYATGLDQIQLEESAGVGLGISACVFLMVALRLWAGLAKPHLVHRPKWKSFPIFLGTGIALLVLVIKLCNEGMPRLITPYYPFLILGILVLIALDGRVIRFRICHFFAAVAAIMAIVLIVISPARPLFPVQWAVKVIARISPSRVERVERVYGVYGSRYDAMKEVRLLLPDSEKSVGFIQTGDVMEATLWRPYGSRRIVDVTPDETLDQLKNDHIHLVIVGDYALVYKYKMSIEELTKKWSATITAKRKPILRASADTGSWYIFELP